MNPLIFANSVKENLRRNIKYAFFSLPHLIANSSRRMILTYRELKV